MVYILKCSRTILAVDSSNHLHELIFILHMMWYSWVQMEKVLQCICNSLQLSKDKFKFTQIVIGYAWLHAP